MNSANGSMQRGADGTKITLPGLVTRRAAEKALFLKVGDAAEAT